MHPRIRTKPEHKQTARDERGTHNHGRQLVLRLALHDSRLLESLLGQAIFHARPDGSDAAGQDHGHAEAHEGKSDLPEIEAVVGAEDEGEGTEEEIQNAQENRGVDIQDETHGFKQEQLKRSQEGVAKGGGDGLGGALDGGVVAVVAGGFPEVDGLAL